MKRYISITCSAIILFAGIGSFQVRADDTKRNANTLSNYTKAVEQRPMDPQAYDSRAGYFAEQGQFEEAINDLNLAIRVDPQFAIAFEHRGIAKMMLGHVEEALMDYNKALELDPTNVLFLCNRGGLYSRKNELDKALNDLNLAIRYDTNAADAYLHRGDVFTVRKEYQKALLDFDRGIQLDGRVTAAYVDRGLVYQKTGRYEEARKDFAHAVELDANYALGHNAMAWLLATCPAESIRNGTNAVVFAQKACSILLWRDSVTLDTLAAAEAEVGDFANAVSYEKRALALASPANAETADMHKRLELYQARKAYRESTDTVGN